MSFHSDTRCAGGAVTAAGWGNVGTVFAASVAGGGDGAHGPVSVAAITSGGAALVSLVRHASAFQQQIPGTRRPPAAGRTIRRFTDTRDQSAADFFGRVSMKRDASGRRQARCAARRCARQHLVAGPSALGQTSLSRVSRFTALPASIWPAAAGRPSGSVAGGGLAHGRNSFDAGSARSPMRRCPVARRFSGAFARATIGRRASNCRRRLLEENGPVPAQWVWRQQWAWFSSLV